MTSAEPRCVHGIGLAGLARAVHSKVELVLDAESEDEADEAHEVEVVFDGFADRYAGVDEAEQDEGLVGHILCERSRTLPGYRPPGCVTLVLVLWSVVGREEEHLPGFTTWSGVLLFFMEACDGMDVDLRDGGADEWFKVPGANLVANDHTGVGG